MPVPEVVLVGGAYMERLAAVMAGRYPHALSLVLCRDGTEIPSGSQRDILIVEECGREPLSLRGGYALTVVLCKDRKTSIRQDASASVLFLFKFQHTDRICEHIFTAYSEVVRDFQTPVGITSDTRLLAVYGPSGGAGTTAVAVAAAMHCVISGYRALYLNLEPVQSTHLYFPFKGEKSLSDLLKDLSMQQQVFLPAYLLRDRESGVYYFSDLRSLRDIGVMDSEDVTALLQSIAVSGLLDYVIADLGTALNGPAAEIIRKSDMLIAVKGAATDTDVKWKRFMQFAGHDEELKSKLVTVFNRCRPEPADSEYPVVGVISEFRDTAPQALAGRIASSSMLELML